MVEYDPPSRPRRSGRSRGCRSGRPLGWTLVELAVVFVVIGIVAGAAIPRLLGMKRGMMIKTTVEELLLLGGVVEQYAQRCPPLAGVTTTFNVTSPGGGGALPQCTANPLDMLTRMLPATFDGKNPYDNGYVAEVKGQAGALPHVRVSTCVPFDDFSDYTSTNTRMDTTCPSGTCGGGACELFADWNLSPSKSGEELHAEKLYTAPGLSEPAIGPRAPPLK